MLSFQELSGKNETFVSHNPSTAACLQVSGLLIIKTVKVKDIQKEFFHIQCSYTLKDILRDVAELNSHECCFKTGKYEHTVKKPLLIVKFHIISLWSVCYLCGITDRLRLVGSRARLLIAARTHSPLHPASILHVL